MVRRLSIHNFGAIKSADIHLKDFNFFIGEQGSGKSTVAKLITVFENYAMLPTEELLSKFEELNISSYFQEDTSLHYEEEERIIHYTDGVFAEASTRKDSGKLNTNLYIPAERFFVSTFSRSLATLVLAKAPIPNTLLEFASLYEKAKNKYPDYNVPMLDLQFQAKEMRETLLLKDTGKMIPFKDSSSGIQSIIPLLMVLDYAVEETVFSRFIVEEPELNLFPLTQVDLLYRMISQCRQLTVTTHSPYLMSALNNLIEAGNVLKLHPEKKEEVTSIIPEDCILDFNNVAAYKMEDGQVFSLLDKEYSLIVADKIDMVSDKQSRIFSALLDLE